MLIAFVDTAGWIGLFNANDSLHVKANTVYEQLTRQRVRLVTTEFVLIEVADALSAPILRSRTIAAIDNLRAGLMKIIPVSEALIAKGWSLYGERLDKEWGLTDCTSFVVMRQHNIHQAMTSDRHFTQTGFQCLL